MKGKNSVQMIRDFVILHSIWNEWSCIRQSLILIKKHFVYFRVSSFKFYRCHEQETDVNLLRSFETAANLIIKPERNRPYIQTNISAAPELTDTLQPTTCLQPINRITNGYWSFTPARMRSSPTHGSTNNISKAKQTIAVLEPILMLTNLQAIQLRKLIEIIPNRAVDKSAAVLQNLIILKLKNNPMTMRADGTPIADEQNQRWFDNYNIPSYSKTNGSQDSASNIYRGSQAIKMKISFNDQHCFEEIILDWQDT